MPRTLQLLSPTSVSGEVMKCLSHDSFQAVTVHNDPLIPSLYKALNFKPPFYNRPPPPNTSRVQITCLLPFHWAETYGDLIVNTKKKLDILHHSLLHVLIIL